MVAFHPNLGFGTTVYDHQDPGCLLCPLHRPGLPDDQLIVCVVAWAGCRSPVVCVGKVKANWHWILGVEAAVSLGASRARRIGRRKTR